MSLLVIRNLTKTCAITPPVEVLRGLNLEVETGGKVLIAGYFGAGESTLLNVLRLLGEPSDGGYLFEDEHVERPPEARRNSIRARKVGFVFQDFHVLGHHSITESLGPKLSISHTPHIWYETTIAGALEAVRLNGCAEALTRLLSGGEEQRLAFARVVIYDLQPILADEPTGSLNQKDAATILELPDVQVEKDATMVIVSYDERLQDWADRMSRLESEVLHED